MGQAAVMRESASLLVACLLLAPGGVVYLLMNQHGGLSVATQRSSATCETVGIPPQAKLYHGVYPGGITGEEDDIAPGNVTSYVQLAGKSVAWVYFSDNWYKGRGFPAQTATWIRSTGSIPFIRLMLRSSYEQNVSEPTFTLDSIINGTFDSDLRSWADAARNFSSPLLVEYGTEVNGFWFSWNGVWSGGGTLNGTQPLGPQRFREAYDHIVHVMRNEGACNITWVFHVNWNDVPGDSWNRLENYYPGDKFVDWIGVSAYGSLSQTDNDTHQLRELMDSVYPRLASLNATKPIVLLEFGASSGNPFLDQTTWARYALGNLTASRWPRLIGFSWWNEPPFRLQDNAALASVFMNYVGLQGNVLGTPVVVGSSVVTTTTTTTSSTTTSSTISTTSITTITSVTTTTTSSIASTVSTTSSAATAIVTTTTASTSQSSNAGQASTAASSTGIPSATTTSASATTPIPTTSTTSTTQQTATAAATTGSGGIPEFPFQLTAGTILTFFVVLFYLAERRRFRL